MREFALISCRLWASKKLKSVNSCHAMVLFFYILTCHHSNSAGCYKLPIQYISADLGLSIEQVQEALEELIKAKLVTYDQEYEEVLIHCWFRFNLPRNEKHLKGTLKQLTAMESRELVDNCLHEMEVEKELLIAKSDKEAKKVTEIYANLPGTASNLLNTDYMKKGYR